ncbi:MAG: acyltransferase [Bacteroidetes bacterium]|jgi:phenylacetate-coenzyme A ligase PaaK-like adenylate-forming protein|nr:acyltransferase [Bacteroidota bacterium]
MQTWFQRIFSINNPQQLEQGALEAFRYQMDHNPVYREFVSHLGIQKNEVSSLDRIPFLPIQFFKTHKVYASPKTEEIIFTSSGTTGMEISKHYVENLVVYEKSFERAFSLFYGNVKDYCILALLPSYLERGGSSLVYMTDKLIKQSGHPLSDFYLHNLDDLKNTIEVLKKQTTKVILLGVSYALLDLADSGCKLNEQFIVMETGGMKGKRREMLKEELHAYLSAAFGVKKIHSEYGMTELLSQAYSKGDGIYEAPPWMKVSTREVSDPLSAGRKEKSGGINVIDLANLYSCPFIATQDLGKVHTDGSFEILGRFDNSDIRGCNLLVG